MATMPEFEMPDFEMPAEPAAPVRRPDVPATPGSADAAEPSQAADTDDADDDDGGGTSHEDAVPGRAASGARALLHRIRVPAVAFVVGAAVVAGAVVAVDAVRDEQVRAEIDGVVAAYVAAIESADAATIVGDPRLDDAVATDALLLAGIAPVAAADVSCDEPRIGDGLATLACDVRVERRTDVARLVLEQVDDAWTIVEGLEVPVRLLSGALVVETVDGTGIDASLASGQQAAWMLPGRYEVTVRTPEQLVVERLEGLVVSGTSGSVRWTSETTQQLDDDVQASALAFIEACAAMLRDGCPVLQQRDVAEPFGVFDVIGRLQPDDPHAMTFDVSIRRPIEDPEEFLVVPVRVDFGEDLDRYDVTAG